MTAEQVNAYLVYAILAPPVSVFGKANGLGTLTALCENAPIEIGNRVWLDTNHNGIQDADEPAVAGVTVSLYTHDGNRVGSAPTDINGNYFFPIEPYQTYTVKLDNPADYEAGGPLFDYVPTLVHAGGDRAIDSDGELRNPSEPIGPDNFPRPALARTSLERTITPSISASPS